jgi:hypothetical protein
MSFREGWAAAKLFSFRTALYPPPPVQSPSCRVGEVVVANRLGKLFEFLHAAVALQHLLSPETRSHAPR